MFGKRVISGVVAGALALGLAWGGASASAEVMMASGEKMSPERRDAISYLSSYDYWGGIESGNLYDNEDGTFTVVHFNEAGPENELTVSVYNGADNSRLSTKQIPIELPFYMGFYHGDDFNYVVYGDKNENDDDSVEVFRLVKYDKAFNRLSHLSIRGCYTYMPSHSGSLRMAENDDGSELTIHTARTRYLSDGRTRHQSQLTLVVDTVNMTLKNSDDVGAFQANHVSHSFDQHVLYDDDSNQRVLVDLGDAYPRGVVLNKWIEDETGGYYSQVMLYEIPGELGANSTGVMVGGFEQSDDNYLVAIHAVHPQLVLDYQPFELVEETERRDVILLVSDKDNTSEENVRKIKLTNYVGTETSASRPRLVKLDDNRFLVMWQEIRKHCTPTQWGWSEVDDIDCGLRYVQVDGDGNLLSDVMTRGDLYLSPDCQPQIVGDRLLWYADSYDYAAEKSTRQFNSIGMSHFIAVEVDGKFVRFDQRPTILGGRTLVPMRAIFEALDATVDWNNATRTATSTLGGTTVSVTIGSNVMYKNGQQIPLDVSAQMIGGRTMVPVRAIAEAFDCEVDWDSETRTVIIERN